MSQKGTMTEADWLQSTFIATMICHLRAINGGSERKQRLFAAACSRQAWNSLNYRVTQEAVEVSERYADGLATIDDLDQASGAALAPLQHITTMQKHKVEAARFDAIFVFPRETAQELRWTCAGRAAWTAESISTLQEIAVGCDLLRCIFGNPCRQISVDPAWQTPAITAMAQAAYDSRNLPDGTLDPGRLAVLSDALEEAGCSEKALLDHLRQPGPHARGCWPIDAILGLP